MNLISRGRRIASALCAALLAGQLGSCVTTVEGNLPKPNKEQEIERRVEAANQYLEKGNTEQAIVHLKRGLEIDPNSATIHMTLAQVFWRTGEYELADEHFRRSITIDGKLSRARNNYAAFLYERGDIEGAIRQLEAVVADVLYEKRAGAFTNLGLAYLRTDRRAEAEKAFDRAVKMDARQAQAWLELADMAFARGDGSRAAALYSRFRAGGARQTPRSLLLGIRLARANNERDTEASYVLQLKSIYPDSAEYREYQAKLAGAP